MELKFLKLLAKKRESIKDSLERGDNQIRTGDKGVADPCLTTWPCRLTEYLDIVSKQTQSVKFFLLFRSISAVVLLFTGNAGKK